MSRECQTALFGMYTMMSTSDEFLRQRYSEYWDRAVVRELGLRNVPASRVLNYPRGITFVEQAEALQSLIVESLLDTVKDLNSQPSDDDPGNHRPAFVCGRGVRVLQGDKTDPDDGGVEILYPYNVKGRGRRRAQDLNERLVSLGWEDTVEGDDGTILVNRSTTSPANIDSELLDQGAARTFIIRYANLAHDTEILSSSYPNGNQGEDLRGINQDQHRYLFMSKGCGPKDYELVVDASLSQTPDKWVCECPFFLFPFNTYPPWFLSNLTSTRPTRPQTLTRRKKKSRTYSRIKHHWPVPPSRH